MQFQTQTSSSADLKVRSEVQLDLDFTDKIEWVLLFDFEDFKVWSISNFWIYPEFEKECESTSF